jgi:hypothetical protein
MQEFLVLMDLDGLHLEIFRFVKYDLFGLVRQKE